MHLHSLIPLPLALFLTLSACASNPLQDLDFEDAWGRAY